MEAAWPSKMLVPYYLNTWCHDPEDHGFKLEINQLQIDIKLGWYKTDVSKYFRKSPSVHI